MQRYSEIVIMLALPAKNKYYNYYLCIIFHRINNIFTEMMGKIINYTIYLQQ